MQLERIYLSQLWRNLTLQQSNKSSTSFQHQAPHACQWRRRVYPVKCVTTAGQFCSAAARCLRYPHELLFQFQHTYSPLFSSPFQLGVRLENNEPPKALVLLKKSKETRQAAWHSVLWEESHQTTVSGEQKVTLHLFCLKKETPKTFSRSIRYFRLSQSVV